MLKLREEYYQKEITTMLLIPNFVKILLHCLVHGCDQEHVPPFMKLFWEEQQKYFSSSSSSSIRYHPMIIKYCLSPAAKFSSAYSDLRYNSRIGSGVMILPSLRTLRDYKNYIRPKRGFNHEVVDELNIMSPSYSTK